MKFRLFRTNSGNYNCGVRKEDKKKYEKYGFKFKSSPNEDALWNDLEPTKCLEFEINTLEELMEFVKEMGEVVLGENSIEIYDGYRE